MAIKPFFSHYPMAFNPQFLQVIRWQLKISIAREFGLLDQVQCQNHAFDGNWRWSKQTWAQSWGFGHVWVHYKTHIFVIPCIFFLTCEDFVCSKQLVPYTWKKVGVFWKALKFIVQIVKTIVLDFKSKPLRGPPY